jgi:hypothetical protein
LTREERFDLYGTFADVLVPLRISGDYDTLRPDCFTLRGLKSEDYTNLVDRFKEKYSKRFNIIKHVYPLLGRGKFDNKNQFARNSMLFEYSPRIENYKLIDSYIPTDKKIIVLAPRYRNGFQRNWNKWPEFYNMVADSDLMKKYNFVVCGKKGEYIPDEKKRFYDINNITLGEKSSLVGLLLVVLERAFFTFGSQSAIPNLSLLHGVEALEFGHEKVYHTKTYNVKNTPVTFITNPKYDLNPKVAFDKMREILNKKESK